MSYNGTRHTDIYPLDPAIEELLDVKSFSDKFDIKDFVGAISEKLIAQSKASPGRKCQKEMQCNGL